MKRINAYYVHSWMSWGVCRHLVEISKKKDNKSSLIICGREFQIPDFDKNQIYEMRFEKHEYNIMTNPKMDFTDILSDEISRITNSIIKNLYLPHIGYKPFQILSNCNCVEKIDFYQEGIQLPAGMTTIREGYMLYNKNNLGSLFTSESLSIRRKLSYNYFSINETKAPIHLKNISLGKVEDIIIKYMPETNIPDIKFALIAGKMTNSYEGFELFTKILGLIKKINSNGNILLKASPSSTKSITDWMQSESIKNERIYYLNGSSSIEKMIINQRVKILISEMFSLPCIAIEVKSCKTKIVSIEKTIIKDYPSLIKAMSERYQYSKYRDMINQQHSLSEALEEYLK